MRVRRFTIPTLTITVSLAEFGTTGRANLSVPFELLNEGH